MRDGESCEAKMATAQIDIQERLLSGAAAERPLYGDLYLPERADATHCAAVVLVFGGSWRSEDRTQQKGYGIALAKAGFVCLATDYRWSSEAKWPAQIDDVMTAVRWLKAETEELDIDPDRIAISGNSSGGHLALMAGATNEVSAVCTYYPPTRLLGLDEETDDDTAISLLGSDATPADYESASPLSYAAKPFPPVLLISGADDTRVRIAHTLELYDALKNAGNTVELHVFAGQDHAFDADPDMAGVTVPIMISFFRRYV